MYTFAALHGQADCALASFVSIVAAAVAHRQEAA